MMDAMRIVSMLAETHCPLIFLDDWRRRAVSMLVAALFLMDAVSPSTMLAATRRLDTLAKPVLQRASENLTTTNVLMDVEARW